MKKYTKDLLEPLVRDSVSVAEVLRKLGKRQAGSISTHLRNVIRKLEIDTSHFLGSKANCGKKHKGGPCRKNWKDILTNKKRERREDTWRLRRALIESGRQYACEECGLKDWRGNPLNLQIDHKDGDWQNNTADNLRFICPNCHSQTPNHSGSEGLTDLTSNARYHAIRRARLKNAVVA
jgi:hypothetical protein